MKVVAVITGDLVKSRKIREGDIDLVINSLKETFNELNLKILNNKSSFEIFRGDSFQAVIQNPEMALLTAIIIRSHLRTFNSPLRIVGLKNSDKPIPYAYTDARIAIGIGKINFLRNKISESQGEAFEKSGHLLDKLTKENDRLGVDTPWNNINSELIVECKLADAIINQWTSSTSEAVYCHLLYGKNQSELASLFNISQPALHKRLVTYGKIGSINTLIKRYTELIINAL